MVRFNRKQERSCVYLELVLQAFGGLNFGSVIVFIAAFVIVGMCFVKAYKLICKFHDEIQGKQVSFEKVLEDNKVFEKEIKNIQPLIADLTTELKDTKETISKISDTQDYIVKEMKTLTETQNNLSKQVNDFEKDIRSQNLNRLRDRLLQIHRYYSNTDKNPLQAWTTMEKEAYDKLFADYEKLGGDGFMHSVVEPEMNSLDVISIENNEEVTELMNSRKNG